MDFMNPNDLRPHPRNEEFFDGMEGQKWKDFLKSVRTSGIIEPIIATEEWIIVSGHQRWKAAKAIGMMKVPVEVKEYYGDADVILRDLIETNLMQRGLGNTNPVKLAKCIVELERIGGIRDGSAGKVAKNLDGNNFHPNTQSDIAEKLKVSQRQLSNYKRLLDLIPELQTAVESGQISATNASAILARLPEAEQKAIAEQIVGTSGKVSRQELEFYKNRVKELSNQKPQVVEKIVEVESPETIQKLRKAEQTAKGYKTDFERERQKYADKQREVLQLKEELKDAREQTEQANFSQKLIENAAFFMTGCGRFISEYGGLVWIIDHLEELPEKERTGYVKAVNAVYAWANTLKQNIQERTNE